MSIRAGAVDGSQGLARATNALPKGEDMPGPVSARRPLIGTTPGRRASAGRRPPGCRCGRGRSLLGGLTLALLVLMGSAAAAQATRYIYWDQYHPELREQGIWRHALPSGGTLEHLVPSGGESMGVAVDGAHVYWANEGGAGFETIGRANLDGTGVN